ncbi:MAG: hypothetical protein ACI80I_001990, partial [Akkermansiaceae bacterium]
VAEKVEEIAAVRQQGQPIEHFARPNSKFCGP